MRHYHQQALEYEERSLELDTQQEVLAVLDEVLSLRGQTATFTSRSPLLGAIPELDSMAVVNILTALEERFDFIVDDDEIDASVFETVGSLVELVETKL